MTAKSIVMGAAGAAPDKTYIEDVFSTYLYTGNGSTQTINNGIDLAGKGGMVWWKGRNQSSNHVIADTNRGISSELNPNGTIAAQNSAVLTSFNSDGFTTGSYISVPSTWNNVTWTFRKAPKFFDVVTYTGNSANRTISHNLGSVPGMIVIKRTDSTGAWYVYHRSNTASKYMMLDATDGSLTASTIWNNTEPTESTFSLGPLAVVNASGGTYVAYLFAHDTTTDGLIQCGSYTGNGSATGPTVSLGWEPQYLMIKNASGTGSWQIIDNMRGMPVGSSDATLQANSTNAESVVEYVSPTATGFQVTSTSTEVNTSGSTYIYMAIRRGPMRTPTDGTKVFSSYTASSIPTATAITTNFPVDLSIIKQRTAANDYFWFDRLRNDYYLSSNTTAAEVASNYLNFDSNTSINTAIALSTTPVLWNFKRAPGFFDVVCYTGNGSTQNINHNLGVVPELIITKRRSGATSNWSVYTTSLGTSKILLLENTTAALDASWFGTPTATQFTITSTIGASGAPYVAYLFASCPGVSKIGTYTGNGTSQTINCGFTNGARFVLIKRTNAASHWYVFDTARGIVDGNDPVLLLNDPITENISYDQIDPVSSGFAVNYNAATDVNVNGATYIYLAIA